MFAEVISRGDYTEGKFLYGNAHNRSFNQGFRNLCSYCNTKLKEIIWYSEFPIDESHLCMA